MSVPTPTSPARRARPPVAGVVLLGLALAACAAAPATPAPMTPPAPSAASPATTVRQSAAQSLAALDMVWQDAGPVTDKTSTMATAIDPATGDLWVAVPFENRYWIFTPFGKYRETWGTAGTGDGQFDFSDHAQVADGFGAIAFAPDGSFYVGDTGNHRVEYFDKHRQFVRKFGSFGDGDGLFNAIQTVATDGKSVYVGDYDIQVFSASGTFKRSFGSGFSTIALDLAGRTHATNPDDPSGAPAVMAVFSADGTQVSSTDLSAWGGRPVAVTVDAAGMSYVGLEQDQFPFAALGVVEIDPAGHITRSWNGGGDVLTVTPTGDALFVTRGEQLDGTTWPYVRQYAVPAP